MPIQSRYTTAQIESVMQAVVDTLNQHECDRELSLMVLGNTVTTVLNQQFDQSQREAVAQQFCAALQKSLG